jgi:hypothetical protein
MAMPVDASDATSKSLIAAGLQTLAIGCDVSAVWTEAANTFVLDAPTLDIGGIVKASARVSLGNVPRQLFTPNVQQAAMAATQIQAGAIEITLRDTGGVDLLIAQYARTQNVSVDDAKQAVVDSLRSQSANIIASDPDATAIVDALAHLLQNPKTAVTIKLTPRGRIAAMALIQAAKADPAATLALFQVDASTMQ